MKLLHRVVAGHRLLQQVAVLGDEQKQQAVDDAQELAVVVLGVEVA